MVTKDKLSGLPVLAKPLQKTLVVLLDPEPVALAHISLLGGNSSISSG
jgi:hypothetical protein